MPLVERRDSALPTIDAIRYGGTNAFVMRNLYSVMHLMNTSLSRRLVLTLLLSLGIAQSTFAQTDESLIKIAVEGFVNGYVQSVERSLSGKHEEEKDWVYKNAATTSAFKDAYRRMKRAAIARVEKADFITLWAGDVPQIPYVLESAKVTAGRATATARTKDKAPPTIKLVLVKQNGTWVIDSINAVNRRR